MKFNFGKPLGTYVVSKTEEEVAKVVLVDDIAHTYGRDRSSFTKLLKKRRIQMQFTVDPVSGQRRRCVTPEVAEYIRQFMIPDEIVPFEASPSENDVEH